MMETPPLPEPGASRRDEDHFTAEQMLAFGESCARMAREEEREACVTVIIEVLRATGLPNIEALAAAIRKG
jgi:hypothetical protein